MTIFNDAGQQQTGDQQLDTLTNETIYIGEGKKYKSVHDADRAFGHLNQHVSTLERENAELRKLAEKQRSIDEVLEYVKQHKTNANGDQGSFSTEIDSRQEVDLDAVIEQTLERKLNAFEQAKVEEKNAEQVRNELLSKYGDKASELFLQKQRELGIDLSDLAKKSPKAVLEFFNKQTQQHGQSSSQGSVNASYLNNNMPEFGTHAYWEQMYKDKKISREQKFLKQHESLTKLGPDAYFKK